MELRTFLLYFATWTLVAITPGPAVMYSMATSARHGFRTGLAGICGIQAGNFVLFAAVALGLGALLAASNGALAVLRIAGAAYLVWLGAGVFVRTFKPETKLELHPETSRDRKSAVQGLLVQVTNPKALLFVSALLPQFIDPRRSPAVQLTILVFTTVSVDAVVLSAYALLARQGAERIGRSRFKLWCERFYGAALVGSGLRLFVAKEAQR
jgi:homoserine/homoserine lactone efflux protein